MSSKKFTVSCLLCKSEVSSSNLHNHYNSKQCQSGGKIGDIPQIRDNPESTILGYFKILCKYCGCETQNKRHESLCELNPEKQIPTNQFIIGKETNNPYVWAPETINKISISNIGKKRSTETKDRISASMKLAVLKYPKSYSEAKNNHRIKIKICSNGFKVRGGWEESFVEYCVKNNIKITQVEESFSYTHEDKFHRYFPDFYLDEYDIFVEVKGYKTPVDDSKWESLTSTHDKKLLIIDSRVIHHIKDNSININDILNNYMY